MSEYRPRLRWIRNPNANPNLNPIPPRQTYEEISPSFGWTQDSQHHYLLVNLPGFKKSDVKLETNKPSALTIKGERLKGESKHERFEKVITVPDNADIQGISMTLEGDSLRVTIPKIAIDNINQVPKTAIDNINQEKLSNEEEKIEKPDESQKVEEEKKDNIHSEEEGNNNNNNNNGDGIREDLGQRDITSENESVIRVVIQKKAILIASILSFTLGFLMSQKFHSPK